MTRLSTRCGDIRSPTVLVYFAAMFTAGCTGESVSGPGVAAVASVVVTPGLDSLFSADDTVRLLATALDASGGAISGKAFSWTSDDESVATVDAAGLVTAAGSNGSATIAASVEGRAGSMDLNVVSGPSGGTTYSSDRSVRIDVPAGALSAPTVLTVELSEMPTNGYLVPDAGYLFGPDGLVFDEPVTLTYTYDPSDLPSTVQEAFLDWHEVVTGSGYTRVAGAVDRAAHTVTAEIVHFSKYAVLGEPDPAIANTATELSIEPDTRYSDIQVLSTNWPCSISRTGIGNLFLYPSNSQCGFELQGGRVRGFAHADVGGCLVVVVGVCTDKPTETVTTKIILWREFTVAGEDGEPALLGSNMSFRINWAAYQFASGALINVGQTSVRISFALSDLTDNQPIWALPTLFEEGASGGVKLRFKGIPIPLGWGFASEESPDEVIASAINLLPGHRYRAAINIDLSAKNTQVPLFMSRAAVGPAVDFNLGPVLPPPGEVRWFDIVVDAGTVVGSP